MALFKVQCPLVKLNRMARVLLLLLQATTATVILVRLRIAMAQVLVHQHLQATSTMAAMRLLRQCMVRVAHQLAVNARPVSTSAKALDLPYVAMAHGFSRAVVLAQSVSQLEEVFPA